MPTTYMVYLGQRPQRAPFLSLADAKSFGLKCGSEAPADDRVTIEFITSNAPTMMALEYDPSLCEWVKIGLP